MLTSGQVNAITYAYMDVVAANRLMDEEETWGNRIQAEAELYEATRQTKIDLETEFPFLKSRPDSISLSKDIEDE